MKAIIYIFSFFFIFTTTSVKAQGPWIREKKHGYFQLGFSSLLYQQVRYNNQLIDSKRNNYDLTNQIYFDYGLYKKADITVILPFKFISYKQDSSAVKKSLTGFGNIGLGLKHALLDKKIKVSVGAYIFMNSILKNNSTGLRTGFDANTILPFITAGSSYKKMYYYIKTGYGLMTNQYSDYFIASGEVGYSIFKKAHLIFNAEVKEPISKEHFFDTDDPSYSLTANYLDRQKFIVYGLKFNYEFIEKKYGLTIGFLNGLNGKDGATNIPVSRSYNIGLYRKF